MTPGAVGFPAAPRDVPADWGDYNGHLNMAYYHVLFDNGIDDALQPLGIGPEAAAATGTSVFVAETHTRYLAEVMIGARVSVFTRFLDHDARAIHYLQTLIDRETGRAAATNEGLLVHVDLGTRKVTPFRDPVRAAIAGLAADHARGPVPAGLCGRIGIRRRAPAV